jgi:uracil-DNA glycosylase
MPDAKVLQNLPILLQRLNETYPEARYELNWETPLQLLVATILAAQSTDERINQVTPGLFAKYPDARAFAEADLTELEKDLKPTGFYRNKARAVQGACQVLVERFGGEVPRTMEELLTLPGVARKTANVVLNNAFRIPSGVIVDTHVVRVSQRLGLTDQKRPEKIEQDLMDVLPREEWVEFGPALVLLGRYTCTHHAPRCGECILKDLCPRRGVEGEEGEEMAKTAKKTAAKKTTAKPAKKPATKKAAPAAPAPARAVAVPSLAEEIPAGWRVVLEEEFEKPYFQALEAFVAQERASHEVYPPEEDVFNALAVTPYEEVKVLLLGQDPYHDAGQAHGMCFSVRPRVPPPPSLVNIFKELESDLGCKPPNNGYLVPWAERGVLLLNAVLTVRAHQANSHKDKGWEQFTDAILAALNHREDPVVFLLWGAHAQKKEALITNSRHVILKSGHPSPLSSKHFFGTRPFSRANEALKGMGKPPIDWQLPDRDPKTGEVLGVPAEKARPATHPTPAPVPAREPEPEALPALAGRLPDDWRGVLDGEIHKASFRKLDEFVTAQRQSSPVYPAEDEVFQAFALTPYDEVKVVLVGEEPSAVPGEAHGLSFSVREGRSPSRALNALFRELRDDLGYWLPSTGDLTPWARQGVLLLNCVLTVRDRSPGSHRNKGWEGFTDGVIRALNARSRPVVFVLFGDSAQKKRKLIDERRHTVLSAGDPATNRSSGTFSSVNEALELSGQPSIHWQLFGA